MAGEPAERLGRASGSDRDPESGSVGLCLHPEDLCVAKVLAGRAKDIRFLEAVFHAGLVDPERVAQKLTTVALRSSETEMLRHAERLLDGVPRRGNYASGPAAAADDIARLHDKLARMRDASMLCGRTNRDGTLCRNDRRACPEHP